MQFSPHISFSLYTPVEEERAKRAAESSSMPKNKGGSSPKPVGERYKEFVKRSREEEDNRAMLNLKKRLLDRMREPFIGWDAASHPMKASLIRWMNIWHD